MELKKAIEQFGGEVNKLDPKHLKNQEEAFQTCLSFLDGVDKSKAFNNTYSSYSLKHIVETPAGRFGIPSNSKYNGYIYEGTFILAALASGFRVKQGKGLKAAFDISTKSLKTRTKEFAAVTE